MSLALPRQRNRIGSGAGLARRAILGRGDASWRGRDSAGAREPSRDREVRRTGFPRRATLARAQAGRVHGPNSVDSRGASGRPVDRELANIGNALFFDPILSLRGDNACAGCHSPAHGFSDSQSIAIGVQNNGVVGAGRRGPRNQRRAPTALNSAFYPTLMWNGRFRSTSGDPFQNSQGFVFPAPEGATRFPAFDPNVTHLLAAQAHLPSTELVEIAGFTGTGGPFDDGFGHPVPPADAAGFATSRFVMRSSIWSTRRLAIVRRSAPSPCAWHRAIASRSPCSARLSRSSSSP